jgi:hypothetical protein
VVRIALRVTSLRSSTATTCACLPGGHAPRNIPASRTCPISLISQGGAGVQLDGFVLVPQPLAAEVRFDPVTWQPVPDITHDPTSNSLILQYADTPTCYGLTWLGETPSEVRELLNDELDHFLRYHVQEHVQRALHGNGEGHFTNAFVRPIEVRPGKSRVLCGLVCSGSLEEVTQALAALILRHASGQNYNMGFDGASPLITGICGAEQ